ncbi:uncharacterized protein LOC117812052 isoform X1 [Notolabrus celidotus]|uniref:uncharacterized protein LOC117812052 isoform X1 n=1 Tax=Notolabrus celidotus TaxID=1203425 RepID=UPI00148F456D|nr:uncharacterized protein LOC117812052 isoform X1 [Notolabrus celidotus]
MSGTDLLRMLVNERLAAAAEEIFVLVEKTISEYQDEVVCSKREIYQLKLQLEHLSVLKPGVQSLKADTQLVTGELLPSLQLCDIKVEQIPVLVQTEIQEHPQVKEEQEDECISPDMETDLSNSAECRLPKPEPTTSCKIFPSIAAATVSVNENTDNRWRESDGSSSPGQGHSTEVIMDQGQLAKEEESLPFCVLKDMDTVNNAVPNEWTAPLSFSDTPHTQPNHPGPSLIKTQNSWISKLEIPWNKLPASLLQALTRGTKACATDRRAMVRAVVSAMQAHCPNPNKAACIEVAKMILSKYPGTFADTTAERGVFGKSLFSLVHKLKTRIENVNRYKNCKRK